MDIKEGILHGLYKKSGETNVAIDPRDECLPIDSRLSKLGEDVLTIYGKQTNSYGTFDQDEDSYRFPALLREQLDDGQALDFVEFTKRSLNLLANRMQASTFATGGYVVFLKYENQGRDWLLVVMLKLKPGTGVDAATKSLTDAMTLDVDHLHEAARVDLAKWQTDEQPYLSFIKRKSGGEDVSKYFRLALGCTEYTDSQQNTKEAMKAVDDYCAAQGWDIDRKRDARRAYHEYCEEKHKAGEPVNLEALSARIDDQSPEAFREFVRNEGYEVNDTFAPHPRTYAKFRRLTGKFGNISVAFDVEDLASGRIVHSSEHHSLTITEISPQLESAILEVNGNGNTN